VDAVRASRWDAGTMSFQYTIGAVTDVGKVRTINEDCFSIDPDGGLFLVADGVGGHHAGDVASTMAIEIITNHVHDEKKPLMGTYSEEFTPATNRTMSGIRLANSAIYGAGHKHAAHQGMATTIAVVRFMGNVMALASVGDSRIYRMRGRSLQCLTVDHSLMAEQVQHGFVTGEEMAGSAYQHALTRALGAEETIQIDVDEAVVLDGDWILLCTDGLTTMVEEDDIARVILGSADDPQKACEALVETANNRGGTDNITVVLIHCKKGNRWSSLVEKAVWSIMNGVRKVYRSMPGLSNPDYS
jgi:serine/threonine protein phosphatase PrpC